MGYDDYKRLAKRILWATIPTSSLCLIGSFVFHFYPIRRFFYPALDWPVMAWGTDNPQSYYEAARSILFAGLDKLSALLGATTAPERSVWFLLLFSAVLIVLWVVAEGFSQATVTWGILKIDFGKGKRQIPFLAAMKPLFAAEQQKYKIDLFYRMICITQFLSLAFSVRCVWTHRIHFPCFVSAAAGFFIFYFATRIVARLGWQYEQERTKVGAVSPKPVVEQQEKALAIRFVLPSRDRHKQKRK